MVKLLDQDVGTTGYGLMGFTWRPEPTPVEKSTPTMHTALAQGASFWNGGEFYGTPEYNSMHILKAYFTKYPEHADKVIISIKGGANPKTMQPEGDEAGVRRSVDEVLKQLDGKKKLDLFECARVDPKVKIEETMKVLASYVSEGKLGGISMSECGAKTIARAAKVHKISAVEVEYSLFSTEIMSNGVAKTCAELGIPIVAYSPLGRGFLTGQVKTYADIEKQPMLKNFPWFQPGNFEKNLEVVDEVEKVAKAKGVTPGQVALAWIKYQSGKDGNPEIIPIPGATTEGRILENMKDVSLTDAEFNEVNELVKKAKPAGGRYPEAISHMNFGESA